MKAATFRHTSAAGGMLVPCQVRGFIAANQGGTAESKIFRPWSMFIGQGFFLRIKESYSVNSEAV